MRVAHGVIRAFSTKQGSGGAALSCDVQTAVTQASVTAAFLHVVHSAQQPQQHAQQTGSIRTAVWQQQQQQQQPGIAIQLLQNMQALHQQLRCYHTSPASHAPLTQQQLQQQQQQQQQWHDLKELTSAAHLQPYQAAAVQAAILQLTAAKQRVSLCLPPCSDINPVITQLVAHYYQTHVVLVLVMSTARARQLRSALQQVQNPSSTVGLNPRVVPGELITSHNKVLIVDMEQLQKMPSASIQLLQQPTGQQGVAIYEEGFLNPDGSSSSSSNGMQQGSLFKDSKRAAAEQLLRQLKFLEPNPGRVLVSISSRGWHMMLPQQQQQQPISSSDAQLQSFELTAADALREGLIRQTAAIQIPTGIQVPFSVAAAAARDVDATATSASAEQQGLASSSSSSAQLSSIMSTAERNALVAEVYRTLANGHKAIAYAMDESHARQLAVTLNLQGISSLVLNQAQSPEDQAAVLEAFSHGPDKLLVTSISFEAAVPFGCDVKCVLMAAPAFNPRVYAARLAPVLLPCPRSSSSTGTGRDHLVVVDLIDRFLAEESSSSSSNGDGSSSSSTLAVTCSTVLGSLCNHLPLPAQLAAVTGSTAAAADPAAAPAAAEQQKSEALPGSCRHRRSSRTAAVEVGMNSSSSSSTDAAAAASLSSSSSSKPVQTTRGDLIWTILDNGSWAIPIKRGRGSNLSGIKILWLSKVARGWVAELEEGLGQMSPLPGTQGKPLQLQKARSTAEAWLKANYPSDAFVRELNMEWRDRPISDHQIMFCERHKIPYDPTWTRGLASNAVDRYVVETMRIPATERQLFLASHMAPYAPAYLLNPNSTTLMYRQAAEHMLEALLTGNFTKSSAQRSSAALKADAAVAAATGAGGTAGQSVGDSIGRDHVLPSRTALVRDLEMQYDAGLRPRYTWTVVNGSDMVLDLMSGSYLWLKQVTAAGGSTTQPNMHRVATSAGAETSGGSSTIAAAAAAGVLDASAGYQMLLELPNGAMHQISGAPAAATALVAAYTAKHTNTSSSSSSSGGAGGKLASPVTLATALVRAERVASSLAAQGHAFLTRETCVRLAGMVGGWKVPSRQSEQHMALPASARQLELLRAAGLPHSRRYTCLDAHRELVRHTKTLQLPEPLATDSQLARIQELKILLVPAAAAVLTAAEAKALLFRVQLAEEKAQQELAKQRNGPVMGRTKAVRKP